MILAATLAGLCPPEIAVRSDPQLQTLTCLFCQHLSNSGAALARHLHREHSNRCDFPVLVKGRTESPVEATFIAQYVLQEIDLQLFKRLKMKNVQGRMVEAFKRINITVTCPPGACELIIQSFNLKPRWTPAGNLIFDGVTGQTIQRMLGPNCLQRNFKSYKSVIDDAEPVKMKWMAQLAKDHQGIVRRETYSIKLSVISKSQMTIRAPRIQRLMT